MKKTCLLIAIMAFLHANSFANNLVMGTPSISGSTVSFTIKWDNSWLVTTGPSNWDAVWVFVKRQACDQASQNPWVHADLSGSGHSLSSTSQLQIDLASDNKGVFIRRSAAGIGNITQVTVTLTLASAINTDNIGVYGMEMVNVPEGQFYIGDGVNSQYRFTNGNTTSPKLITQAIDNAGLGARTNYNKDGLGSSVDLPNTYPIGYKRFYCMKYEITCAQYVGFLNTLTYEQQLHRQQDFNWNTNPPTSSSGTSYMENWGYKIVIKTPGVSTTTLTPAVYACDANANGTFDEDCDGLGFPVSLRKVHWLAYLDWAALRPMTEFEYEKACRGPLQPVADEFSWGSTDISNSYNELNWKCGNEVPQAFQLGQANLGTSRSHRVGMEATANTDRVHAGATYYGILNMTGGMVEMCVGGWSYDYSTFTTANGDGNLTSFGNTDMTTWNSMQFWNKGASLVHYSLNARVSERNWGNDDNYGNGVSGRGVRSY
jgi:formylglycine-generating enzyme required for sulfatase activity